MTKQAQWKIVDQNGDLVMSADDVATQARFVDTTPRQWAQKHAKDFDDIDYGHINKAVRAGTK